MKMVPFGKESPYTYPGSSTTSADEPCWATSAQFAAHRSIITRLYIKEAKSLNQVIDIMARDYNFRATARMYKQRFATWNLRKNNKPKGYKPKSQARSIAPHALQKTRGPTWSPSPSFISAPESLRLLETIIRSANVQFSGGSPEPYLMRAQHEDVIVGLHLLQIAVRSATRAIELNRFDIGFNILQKTFDSMVSVYKACYGNVNFFLAIFLSMLRLPEAIASHCLEFVNQLAPVMLPSEHPIVLTWRTLLKADRQCIWDNALCLIDKYFEVAKDAYGTSNPVLKTLAATICDPEMYFDHKKKSSPGGGTAEEERMAMTAVKAHLGEEYASLHDRLTSAYSLLYAGDPSKARDMAADVSAVCDAHRGSWHYNILKDRSLALQFGATTSRGGGSRADGQRAAARYAQHTLGLATSMKGIVSQELTDSLGAVITGGHSGDAIMHLGVTANPSSPHSPTMITPTTTPVADDENENDDVMHDLTVALQKMGVDGIYACTTTLQLRLDAVFKEDPTHLHDT